MVQSVLLDHLNASLMLFLLLAGPPLLAALVVGLFVGLLQAATQIQDQTMPLTFKLVTVLAVLAASSSLVLPPLVAETTRVLDEFAVLTR